jgi:hypothetical protein
MTLETSSVERGLTTTWDFPWYLFSQSLLKLASSSAVAEPSRVESKEEGEERNERRVSTWVWVNLANRSDRGGIVEACRLASFFELTTGVARARCREALALAPALLSALLATLAVL